MSSDISESILPEPLSANIKGSFAYNTVKDRLPYILTKVIDILCRKKDDIALHYGDNASEGIKMIVAQLSKLKNEMQTNKPIQVLKSMTSLHDDTSIWNDEYQRFTKELDEAPRWYTAPWLYVECYMYKKIHNIFVSSCCLKDYDPFQHQKHDALIMSMTPIESLITHVYTIIESKNLIPSKTTLEQLVEVSLWGNQCDLSISAGNDNHRETNIITGLESLKPHLLINEVDQIWHLLTKPNNSNTSHLDLVLDNAGFELVTDLCLLTYLMEAKLITSATIHVKTRPWFVSDTTKYDLRFTIDELRKNKECEKLALMWHTYIEDGKWIIEENMFWTTSITFNKMKEVDSQLYKSLSSAKLIIFKGDLNYRKLVGDLDWPNSTNFTKALCGFTPTTLLALRTAKGGPVVGLGDDKDVISKDNDWYYSGKYGMIQVSPNNGEVRL